jgi:hypothetical protein
MQSPLQAHLVSDSERETVDIQTDHYLDKGLIDKGLTLTLTGDLDLFMIPSRKEK